MNDIITNVFTDYEIKELLKYIWIFSILKLLFLFIIAVTLIVICIILNDISLEVNHFMYHAFDCCHNLF